MAGNKKTVREAGRRRTEINARAEANTGAETNTPTGHGTSDGNCGMPVKFRPDPGERGGAPGRQRQTVSNWENGRSYPDIGSVVKMSELYSVSLDKLLKGMRL